MMEEVIPLCLSDIRGLFPLSLLWYTKYTEPYALRQQISVRCIVACHCINFDKQAVSQVTKASFLPFFSLAWHEKSPLERAWKTLV